MSNVAHAAAIGAPRLFAASPQASDRASLKTWIAVIGRHVGAFMAVLNIQIINASLLDIQGGIGAGVDDGGWISTSYLIGEIIVIPLTDWLAGSSRSAATCWSTPCCSWSSPLACAFAHNLGR